MRNIGSNVVTIVADATFFGRRSDRLGTLVFKDVISGKIIANKHIERENADDYKQLVDELLEKGFTIQGAVVDGKRGVAKAFGDIVKIGDIRTVNRNMSGHCIGTYLDSKSLDIRTLFAQDRYVRTA